MPKLWALKDFTSSVYKLHKITNSPSPLQNYLVKHVLYCFSLMGQAAKARQHLSSSKQWRESIWCQAESLAASGKNRRWIWSAASKNNSQTLLCAVGRPKG